MIKVQSIVRFLNPIDDPTNYMSYASMVPRVMVSNPYFVVNSIDGDECIIERLVVGGHKYPLKTKTNLLIEK